MECSLGGFHLKPAQEWTEDDGDMQSVQGYRAELPPWKVFGLVCRREGTGIHCPLSKLK
jgi:hypothetical protein